MRECEVGLFAEDSGHEEFARAMVNRIGAEEGLSARISVFAGRGGHGRVIGELKIFQRTALKYGGSVPDLLIVVIDANCKGWNQARGGVRAELDSALGQAVVACPDPHVERWYLADPESLHKVAGASSPLERKKCERDRYKKQLVDTILRGGHVPTLGGVEFARELVQAMDLHRAGQNDDSLRAFIDETRSAFRRVAGLHPTSSG